MKAEIKGISCSDRQDFETWQPDRPEEVYLCLDLRIGLTGGEGADLFQLVVSTPKAIQGRAERRWCKLLVVQQYDWKKIESTLERWVAECDGPTWEKIIDCLRHHFDWEYAGM